MNKKEYKISQKKLDDDVELLIIGNMNYSEVAHLRKGESMANVITVINQKGGVGKTTTAAALGAGLFLKGKRILFIDLDPQGNLTYSLDAQAAKVNILDILTYAEPIKSGLKSIVEGDILISSPELAAADLIINETGKEYRLRELIEPLKREYDFIIIDTPPALGILTINALTASDKAIIPAQADIYSLQGIGQLYETLRAVQRYTNPGLTVAGILLTRYNSRAVISKNITEAIENTAAALNTRVFDAKIREGVAVKEAQAMQQNIFSYAPKSNPALDYMELVDEVAPPGH